MRAFRTCFAAAILATSAAAAVNCDADNGGIKLPAGFCALVVANNLGPARHIFVASNGDAYVALQGTGEKGGVIALRDADGDGKFEVHEHFGQDSLTGIGIRNGYLYTAGFNTITRYKLTLGQLKPTGGPETVVAGLPGVREHGDKGIAFDGRGGLYVNIGAPSNACQVRNRQPKSLGQDPCPILEKEGGIWKFDENKLGQKQENGAKFATGLRQMLAIAYHDNAVWTAMNNRDSLDTLWPGMFTAKENAERPSEALYRVTQGANFGWPYCFFDFGQKKMILNPEYGGDGKQTGRCSEFTPPTVAFPAHWAPVALTFHDGRSFPAHYKDGVFIAFHGSWNRAPQEQAGYNVTFQAFANGKPSGDFEVFASGFAGKSPLMNPSDAVARPDGVAEGPDGSLFITDSEKGKVWRVIYKGNR